MKVGIALFSLFSVFGALNANESAIKFCSKADYEAIKSTVGNSPYRLSCASDAGVEPEQIESFNSLTPAQADALIQSDNCKQLFDVVQIASSKHDCFELSFVHDITWSMVTGSIKMITYPKVSERCDLIQLQSGLTPLMTDPNIVPCFSAANIYYNIFTKTIPTTEQLETFRNTPACHALFDNFKNFFVSLPHCTVDHEGYDIRSLEVLSFDDFVSWTELYSDYFHSIQLAQPTALAMAAIAPSSDDKLAVITSSFAAGVMMTLVAMYVYTKYQRGNSQNEETTSLLHT